MINYYEYSNLNQKKKFFHVYSHIYLQRNRCRMFHVLVKAEQINGMWGSDSSPDGQFKRHSDMGVDSNDCIYVIDLMKDLLQKFIPNVNFIRKCVETEQVFIIRNIKILIDL